MDVVTYVTYINIVENSNKYFVNIFPAFFLNELCHATPSMSDGQTIYKFWHPYLFKESRNK